jgi:hypothetical protein
MSEPCASKRLATLAPMARRPRSIRADPDKWDVYDGPFEGVPDWLLPSVIDWVFDRLGRYPIDEGDAQRLEQRLRISIDRRGDDFENELVDDRELLLDVVDEILLLERWDPNAGNARLIQLMVALANAGSVYIVKEDADGHFELQRRLPDEVLSAADAAMSATDRPAEHLRAAWSKTFGRDPDANGAYEHAVKAVETAGKPTVSPNNQRTTLGTMIADMRAKPEKWTTVLHSPADVEKVIALMELLWQGHFRHGDEAKPISHQVPEAEVAVQIAITLVQIFRSGAIRLA